MDGSMWQIMIQNPQGLRSIYKELPGSENLQITSIELVYNGPTLLICILFPIFPDFPAKKWHPQAKHFSAMFSFSLEEISIKKFGTQNMASIYCEPMRNPNMISVSIVGSDIDIGFISYIGRLKSFSAT